MGAPRHGRGVRRRVPLPRLRRAVRLRHRADHRGQRRPADAVTPAAAVAVTGSNALSSIPPAGRPSEGLSPTADDLSGPRPPTIADDRDREPGKAADTRRSRNMATIEFTAFPRTGRRSRRVAPPAPRAARRPASSTAASAEPTPIELDHNALIHALKNEAFHASILTMKLDGSAHAGAAARRADAPVPRAGAARRLPAHRREQEDPHEGAAALRQRERCRRRSSVGGAIISHVLNELDVSCLPKDLPEFIEVDLSALEHRASRCTSPASSCRRESSRSRTARTR